MRSCPYCAGPIKAGSDVCPLCGGLVPAPSPSGRSRHMPEDELAEHEPAGEVGWLRPPKVRAIEKPSPRTRLVEMAALVAFVGGLGAGGVIAFELHVAQEGKVGALFTALGVMVLLVVPALLFGLFAAVAVGAAAVLLESALAPLLRRASPHTMPPLPRSVLAKTDALESPPPAQAEEDRITKAAERPADIQRPEGERQEPSS